MGPKIHRACCQVKDDTFVRYRVSRVRATFANYPHQVDLARTTPIQPAMGGKLLEMPPEEKQPEIAALQKQMEGRVLVEKQISPQRYRTIWD